MGRMCRKAGSATAAMCLKAHIHPEALSHPPHSPPAPPAPPCAPAARRCRPAPPAPPLQTAAPRPHAAWGGQEGQAGALVRAPYMQCPAQGWRGGTGTLQMQGVTHGLPATSSRTVPPTSSSREQAGGVTVPHIKGVQAAVSGGGKQHGLVPRGRQARHGRAAAAQLRGGGRQGGACWTYKRTAVLGRAAAACCRAAPKTSRRRHTLPRRTARYSGVRGSL